MWVKGVDVRAFCSVGMGGWEGMVKMESRGLRRRLTRSSVAAAGPAVALLAGVAPAWAASNAPTISFPGTDPLTWTINRQSKAIANVDCTLDGDPTPCGTQTLSFLASSSKSTTYEVSLPTLQPGEHTFVVDVTLTDHETVSGSTMIWGGPISALALVSPDTVFPSGVSM
jgi:hypothetical protein